MMGGIINHADSTAANDGLMRELTGAREKHCVNPFALMLDSHGE